MGGLKVPYFVLALVAIALVVLVEVASPLVLARSGGGGAGLAGLADLPAGTTVGQPAGRGIPYLALIDAVTLFTIGLMAVGLLVPDRLHARLQGVITLVAAVILIV